MENIYLDEYALSSSDELQIFEINCKVGNTLKVI